MAEEILTSWQKFTNFLENANEGIDGIQNLAGGIGGVVGSFEEGRSSGQEGGFSVPVDVNVKDSGGSIQKIALILGAAAIGVAIIIAISRRKRK